MDHTLFQNYTYTILPTTVSFKSLVIACSTNLFNSKFVFLNFHLETWFLRVSRTEGLSFSLFGYCWGNLKKTCSHCSQWFHRFLWYLETLYLLYFYVSIVPIKSKSFKTTHESKPRLWNIFSEPSNFCLSVCTINATHRIRKTNNKNHKIIFIVFGYNLHVNNCIEPRWLFWKVHKPCIKLMHGHQTPALNDQNVTRVSKQMSNTKY